MGRDLASVGADDGLADGEPQPHSNDCALPVAAMKLVEQARRVAGWQAWAIVIDHDPDGLALGDGRNSHVRAAQACIWRCCRTGW